MQLDENLLLDETQPARTLEKIPKFRTEDMPQVPSIRVAPPQTFLQGKEIFTRENITPGESPRKVNFVNPIVPRELDYRTKNNLYVLPEDPGYPAPLNLYTEGSMLEAKERLRLYCVELAKQRLDLIDARLTINVTGREGLLSTVGLSTEDVDSQGNIVVSSGKLPTDSELWKPNTTNKGWNSREVPAKVYQEAPESLYPQGFGTPEAYVSLVFSIQRAAILLDEKESRMIGRQTEILSSNPSKPILYEDDEGQICAALGVPMINYEGKATSTKSSGICETPLVDITTGQEVGRIQGRWRLIADTGGPTYSHSFEDVGIDEHTFSTTLNLPQIPLRAAGLASYGVGKYPTLVLARTANQLLSLDYKYDPPIDRIHNIMREEAEIMRILGFDEETEVPPIHSNEVEPDRDRLEQITQALSIAHRRELDAGLTRFADMKPSQRREALSGAPLHERVYLTQKLWETKEGSPPSAKYIVYNNGFILPTIEGSEFKQKEPYPRKSADLKFVHKPSGTPANFQREVDQVAGVIRFTLTIEGSGYTPDEDLKRVFETPLNPEDRATDFYNVPVHLYNFRSTSKYATDETVLVDRDKNPIAIWKRGIDCWLPIDEMEHSMWRKDDATTPELTRAQKEQIESQHIVLVDREQEIPTSRLDQFRELLDPRGQKMRNGIEQLSDKTIKWRHSYAAMVSRGASGIYELGGLLSTLGRQDYDDYAQKAEATLTKTRQEAIDEGRLSPKDEAILEETLWLLPRTPILLRLALDKGISRVLTTQQERVGFLEKIIAKMKETGEIPTKDNVGTFIEEMFS